MIPLLVFSQVFTFSQYVHALKPQKEYVALPSDYGIIYRDVSFLTKDSLKITGWFYPAQDTTGISNDLVGRKLQEHQKGKPRPYQVSHDEKCPTIVICDGDAGNMSFLIIYAYHLIISGYNVLTFDWRGFGKSDEWPMDQDRLSYVEFLNDYDAAIDYVKKQPEVDPNRIVVHGFSTGAYLSFAMAAKRNDVAAFIGRALLTSFDDTLDLLQKLNPQRKIRAPDNYPEEYLPINASSQVDIPCFLIVGEFDDRTPPWMSRKIYDNLKGAKELWIVPGCHHGGQKGPDWYKYPEYFNRVLNFCDRYVK